MRLQRNYRRLTGEKYHPNVSTLLKYNFGALVLYLCISILGHFILTTLNYSSEGTIVNCLFWRDQTSDCCLAAIVHFAGDDE